MRAFMYLISILPYLILSFLENRFQKKPFGQVMTDELDEHGRPQFKMVLLCGPPGLGKTTLAHMVAKLAGIYLYGIMSVAYCYCF